MKTSQCDTNKDDSAIEDNVSQTFNVGSPNELNTTESSPRKEDNDSSNTLISSDNKSPCQRKRKLRKSNHRQAPVKTVGSPSSSTCSQANDTINYNNSVKRYTDAKKINNDIRNSRPSTSTERDRLNQEPHFQHYYSESSINNNAATELNSASAANNHRYSTSSYTKGVQGWRNLRAVMLYYCSLRRIKRNGALNINLKKFSV